ncbi:MAG: nicotinate-nucleotide--dimethylbenzimidazole phosphoribosyltransferase [Actinobacteria bacterium]|nr:nicotinate-nucleotide--dimethylbenzimidazole phosphoribosyltransferase [Actinomycetota bacterium]
MIDLAELARPVSEPDQLGGGGRRDVGRLADLAGWLARAQGQWPPRDPVLARLMLVSELAADGLGEELRDIAALADAAVHPVTLAVADADAGPEPAAASAVRAGAAAADTEIDAGADLLLLAGEGGDDAAAAVIAALGGLEPTSVATAGTGPDPDDRRWSASVLAIRDLLRRLRPHLHDPGALLAVAGSPMLAAQVGLLLRAAARRTPVILDGLAPCAAAVLASLAAPALPAWCLAGHRTGAVAQEEALHQLGLDPTLDLGIVSGRGYGALLGLATLRVAVRLTTDDEPTTTGTAGNPPGGVDG